VRDDSFVLMFNAAEIAVTFSVPPTLGLGHGELLVDTSLDHDPLPGRPFDPALPHELAARSMTVVRFARAGAS
jgi:hypothetical protein